MRHFTILTWASVRSNIKNVKKLDLFERGWGICVGELDWFKCYFSMIFE